MKHHRRKKKKKAPQQELNPSPTVIIPSEDAPTPDTDANEANTQAQPAKPPASAPSTLDVWTSKATIVIAIATIVYTGAALRQLSTLEGQLDEMQAARRPWVGLDETVGFNGYGAIVEEDGTIRGECSVTPKNFGDYPATIVRIHAELIVTQDCNSVIERIKEFSSEPNPKDLKHVLFPGTDRTTTHIVMTNEASERLVFLNAPPGYEVFIAGYILYQDQFMKSHSTRFAYRAQNENFYPPKIRFDLAQNVIVGSWKQYHTCAD